MTTPKHSPGPWRVATAGPPGKVKGYGFFSEDGTLLDIMLDSPLPAADHPDLVLMALAPEMLELLGQAEQLPRYDSGLQVTDEWMGQLGEVLRKARGE